jgi:hypothetical protein
MRGTATYKFTSEGDQVAVNLPGGEYLIFIIIGSFSLDNNTTITTGRGLGYFVSDASFLTLELATAVMIISSY